MDVPGLFAVGAVAVVLVAGAVLQNEQKMTKNVSWILKINGFRPGSGERLCTQLLSITTLRTKTRTMEWRGTNGCLL
jgi:hypothetical protein